MPLNLFKFVEQFIVDVFVVKINPIGALADLNFFLNQVFWNHNWYLTQRRSCTSNAPTTIIHVWKSKRSKNFLILIFIFCKFPVIFIFATSLIKLRVQSLVATFANFVSNSLKNENIQKKCKNSIQITSKEVWYEATIDPLSAFLEVLKIARKPMQVIRIWEEISRFEIKKFTIKE